MRLEYTPAFLPLMDKQIVISVVSGGKRRSVTIKAHVARGNPYANNVGGAYIAEVYSVSFPMTAISSDVAITRGGTIRVSDTFNTILTVQNAYTLNGLYILECSCKERGGL